jgi:hypothetical protein
MPAPRHKKRRLVVAVITAEIASDIRWIGQPAWGSLALLSPQYAFSP